MGIPKDRLLLLHNFVDTDSLGAKETEEFTLDPDWLGESKLVGYAGRLTYNKGLLHLVEAIHILRDEPLKFLIAGVGAYQKKVVELLKQHQLEDKVHLSGYLDNLPAFFNSIDVFVSPSLMEAFGLVHLEAQAAGCPVIAFDIEAIRETIGSANAMLAIKGDSADLVRCIREVVYNQPLQQQLIQRGLANANKFSLTKHLEKLNRLYQSISGKG
jgi:glycosyltransferase involved in cell wall biosynthesis